MVNGHPESQLRLGAKNRHPDRRVLVSSGVPSRSFFTGSWFCKSNILVVNSCVHPTDVLTSPDIATVGLGRFSDVVLRLDSGLDVRI